MTATPTPTRGLDLPPHPATGAVPSSELSFLGDTDEFDVEPYAVMS